MPSETPVTWTTVFLLFPHNRVLLAERLISASCVICRGWLGSLHRVQSKRLLHECVRQTAAKSRLPALSAWPTGQMWPNCSLVRHLQVERDFPQRIVPHFSAYQQLRLHQALHCKHRAQDPYLEVLLLWSLSSAMWRFFFVSFLYNL